MNNSMELIYKWLLLHMGNEANYYTILNCQRDSTPEGVKYLRVMGRLREFKVMSLLIYFGQIQDSPVNESEQSSKYGQPQSLSFANEQQVIDYLTTGEVVDSVPQTDVSTLHLLILAPSGDAGQITFPPEKTS